MIQETVNAILEAEAKADEITSQANEEAKRIVTDAEAGAEKLRFDTVRSVKEERKKVADSAQKEGDKEYEKIKASIEEINKARERRANLPRRPRRYYPR